MMYTYLRSVVSCCISYVIIKPVLITEKQTILTLKYALSDF